MCVCEAVRKEVQGSIFYIKLIGDARQCMLCVYIVCTLLQTNLYYRILLVDTFCRRISQSWRIWLQRHLQVNTNQVPMHFMETLCGQKCSADIFLNLQKCIIKTTDQQDREDLVIEWVKLSQFVLLCSNIWPHIVSCKNLVIWLIEGAIHARNVTFWII